MLGLVSMVTACDESAQGRRCVDSAGMVVAEEQCRHAEFRRFFGEPSTFSWYYGGVGGNTYGTVVSGGSYSPPGGYSSGGHSSGGGFSTARASGAGSESHGSSVGRGGFGGSASAHGGGGS